MRHYHLTKNLSWRPIINVDKLWTLVPAEQKAELKEDSEVVPVIDTLHHGYAKVLGNGQCVVKLLFLEVMSHKPRFAGSPSFPSS